jgi:8-oxo-dGTP diphosphatase
MAIFDLDDTLFSTHVREKAARRAGLITGEPYPSKNRSYPQGVSKFLEFFDSPERFRSDPLIEGALDYVNGLTSQGYVIAYLTARRGKRTDETIQHLKSSGFPVFETDTREPLVFLMPKKQKSTTYKTNVIRKLQQHYEVQYFFDDQLANRQVGLREGIIGVYDLRDHLGTVRGNPIGETRYDLTHYDSNLDRTSTTGMVSEEAQAAYYARQKAKGAPKKSVEMVRCIRCNREEFADALVEDSFCRKCAKELQALNNPPVPKGYREAAGCLVQRASDNKILFLRRSKKETSKHGLYEFPGGKLEKGETPREAALIETKEEAGLDVKIIRQLPSHVDHTMKKVYHCFLAAPKKGARVKLSEEHDMHKWVSPNKKWPKTKLSHHARFMLNHLKESKSNPRTNLSTITNVLPIMSGEPTGKHTKLGAVFAEVVIGRNIVKDVGEVVQGIYRGLIGGRTSMAEKRMAMGVATMQKELSDRTKALGGNAACNLKVDYELLQGTATITIIATADAITMARPPKRNPRPIPQPNEVKVKVTCTNCEGEGSYRHANKSGWTQCSICEGTGQTLSETGPQHFKSVDDYNLWLQDWYQKLRHPERYDENGLEIVTNPRIPLDGMEDKKVKQAKKKYKKFHGGKEPVDVHTESIDIGDVWYALGPCWSIGYMSPKETGDEEQKYIHHVNEDSKDGNFPMMYATVPEGGQPMIVIKGGSMKIGMRDGLAWLID